MIKAAIFDIGGVVACNTGGYIRNDITKTLGVSKEEYEKACHVLVPLLNTNKITEKEFWKRFVTMTHTTKVVPENLWSRTFLKKRKLRKEVVRIIEELRKKGLKLAALSNVIRAHSGVNDKKRIYELFDFSILSFEVGLKKPDPEIYQLAFTKLGLKPEETVFIDNKLQNVKAARKLGAKGILYISPNQLRKSLIKLDLLA